MPASDDLLWEHGSDFAYPSSLPLDAAAPAWRPNHTSYWHSGRDALRALILKTKPKRVLFPSFYCQDVYGAAAGVDSIAYADGPEDEAIAAADTRAGDLIVVTNTYGLRSLSPLTGGARSDVIVVEDHTHDPHSAWARSSSADYAFASLRKWFPVPDGGVLWSPKGHASIAFGDLSLDSSLRSSIDAPAFSTSDHDAAATVTLDRLSGMLLKARYLAGESVSKEAFRALSIRGEEHIGRSSEPIPMSPIARALYELFPSEAWRTTRRTNHELFVSALGSSRAVDVLSSPRRASPELGVTPYCVVLRFETNEKREAVRSHLVKHRIYPAVLWPIDASLLSGIPAAHVELAKRILCLHCDHRYEEADMTRVAREVIRALGDR